MGDVLDAVGESFQNVFDAVEELTEKEWQTIGAPLSEWTFNLLGYDDETIINGFIISSPFYATPWIVPWKKIPMNRIRFGTDMMDEILNVFISGDHVRIRAYLRKVESLGFEPSVIFQNGTIPKSAIDSIIEGIEGEPITIQNIKLRLPSLTNYGKEYLLNNSGTTGYTYDTLENTLTDTTTGQVYYLDPVEPLVYDAVNNAYDVVTLTDLKWFGLIETARNETPPSWVATYEDRELVGIIDTAINTLPSSWTPTYDNSGAPFVTIDTARDQSITVDSTYRDGSRTIRVDTARDNRLIPVDTATNTAADPAYTYNVNGPPYSVTVDTAHEDPGDAFAGNPPQTYSEYTPTILEELVPAQSNPRKQFEVKYTIDSDSAPRPRKWWFHQLDDAPHTYPQLYINPPTFPADEDKRKVLPIAPIKRSQVWVNSLDNQFETDWRNALRRYGLNLDRITQALQDDPAGNDDDITAGFVLFAVNLAKATSQVQLKYLFDFFSEFAYTSTGDLTVSEYNQLLDDIALVQEYVDGMIIYQVTKGRDEPYVYLQNRPDDARMIVLMEEYAGIDYQDYRPTDYPDTFETDVGFNARDVLASLRDIAAAQQTVYTIKYDQFSLSLSYARASKATHAGVVAGVDKYNKIIDAGTRSCTVQHQFDASNYEEIIITDLSGYQIIRYDGTDVTVGRLDFVGSDHAGINVQNNLLIPLIYGFITEQGVVDRQRLLYESVQIQLIGVDVIQLRYYETEDFLVAFDFVLKVAAVIYIAYTGDFEGAAAIWTFAQIYGAKIAIEALMQEILLRIDLSPEALAVLAIVIGIVAAGAGVQFDWMEFTIDQSLLAIQVASDVYVNYTQVKIDQLYDSASENLADYQEESERIQEQIDGLVPTNAALLDYIKQQITLSISSPDNFYRRHLNRSLVEEALNLDDFIDVTRLLDLEHTMTVKQTRDL